MYIRTRLAMWFAFVMAAVLVSLSFGVYQLTRHNLLQEIERDVRDRAGLLAAAARPEAGIAELRPLQLDDFSAPDFFVQVLGADGTSVGRSANLEGRNLPFDRSVVRGGGVEEAHLDGRPLFLSGEPILVDGRTRGYVLVARSPLAIYRALGRMRSLLYPGAAAALVVAAVAGWLLVRRSLRPLEQVGNAAADIAAAHDHTARLRYRGRADEIGRVADTINGMLVSLEHAHEEVADSNLQQRRFLADVSHELRTPLTIMLSSLDVLARVHESDHEFATEALSGLRAEVRRMARMVSQLLIMARSERDATARRGPILLAELVADACRECTVNGEGRTVEWRDLRALDEVVVEGDPDYLKQLFLILLDNALKYSPEGGTVQVSGGTDRRSVSISVLDTGIGIASEDQERIFDRFYRGANARFREGTGLGLAIARHIAEQHGGAITVESEPGRGSRFTVSLPRIA